MIIFSGQGSHSDYNKAQPSVYTTRAQEEIVKNLNLHLSYSFFKILNTY